MRLVKRLRQVIPGVFSMDVLAAGEVVGLIRYTLQNPTGLVRP